MRLEVRQQIRNEKLRRRSVKGLGLLLELVFKKSPVFKTLTIPGYRHLPLLWKSRRMKGDKPWKG